MKFSDKYKQLYKEVESIYLEPLNKGKLLFHGWHHVKFVHDKAILFADDINANVEMVAVAALVHDLNYIFSDSLDPFEVENETKIILEGAGYEQDFVNHVIETIASAHTSTRLGKSLSLEAMALSDGDTVFKALPTTPILFSSKFIAETGYSLSKLAGKIVDDQRPLLDTDTYFYTDKAKEMYLEWAEIGVKLWECMADALKDESVIEMLENAKKLGVL